MASWVNRAFGRQPNPTRANQNSPSRSNNSSPAQGYNPNAYLNAPAVPPTPASPSLAASLTQTERSEPSGRTPLFFREEYSGFIAKGNFMPLAIKPQEVEEGEWLAHQLAEQYRLLAGMVKVVQEVDPTKGKPLCNDQTCPTMTAGTATFTWIDQNRNPMNLPAPTYIRHIQTWVNGKILDPTLFPTDTFTSAPALPSSSQIAADANYWLGKPSGFPQRFESEMKNMYKQMFRCYAHLYWSHWMIFWDVNAYRELNTCFVHFTNVGRLYGLLSDKDAEPMQPLLDVWVKQGVLPRVEKSEQIAPRSGAAPPAVAASSSALVAAAS